MEKLSPQELEASLHRFTGTTQWYVHRSAGAPFRYTDGVKHLAEQAGAFWMLDIIASYQTEPDIATQPFQVYKFAKREDGSMRLSIQDGNYNELATQEIEFTDFPLSDIELWFTNDVALLPSEY